MTQDIQGVLKGDRKWLEDNEVHYLKAQQLIEQKSLQLMKELKVKMMPLMMYDPRKDEPHVAVFVVSSMQERLAGLFADLEFMNDYEERKARYQANAAIHGGDDE
jgi:hypothetical protein